MKSGETRAGRGGTAAGPRSRTGARSKRAGGKATSPATSPGASPGASPGTSGTSPGTSPGAPLGKPLAPPRAAHRTHAAPSEPPRVRAAPPTAPDPALRAKAARILAVLDELYPDPQIPLDHRDAFTLLVAVVLSAQTTDARVNLVTPALFARAPTPEELARLSVPEIHALIQTCGLAPAKARHLHALSKILVDEHGGEVPRTFEELEALPGVGHKTASVVMVQAFGIPAFPVDTHIHRLAARWGLSSGKNVAETERDLKALWPPESWSRAHIEMILFGREHCPALRHEQARCPICSWAEPAQPGAHSRTVSKAGKRAQPSTGSRAQRTTGARARRTTGSRAEGTSSTRSKPRAG